MDWSKNIAKTLEFPGKFLANGGHAQQTIPAQHRLLNAGGMAIGWFLLDQIRDIAFGVTMKSEGEYVEVKREDVPAPLRFLHKSIAWDPHSETAENQWKKLAYQLLPGVGAGVGAVMGSEMAFNMNGANGASGRAQQAKALNLKGVDKLGLMDLDFVSQYAKSRPLRILAGFFGTFSAASGLTFLYGAFLNPAFASANGAKIFAGNLAKGNMAPHKALPAQLGVLSEYVKEAMHSNHGQMSEEWAHQFADRVLRPLFGHELNTPELQAKAVHNLQSIVQRTYEKAQKNGMVGDALVKNVTEEVGKVLSKADIDATLLSEFGLDPKNATVANTNPVIRKFNTFLSSLGLSKEHHYHQTPKRSFNPAVAMPVAGVAAAAIGLGAIANTASAATTTGQTSGNNVDNVSASVIDPHPKPDAAGKTPAEYVHDAMAMHNANRTGQPPALLKWMGDAQLAVLPKNRILCAIGLTSGLMIAGSMAKIATGKSLDGSVVELSKVPTFLQGLHEMKFSKTLNNLVKDYNPKGIGTKNNWIKYAQWATYSLGGLMGIKLGTDTAYSNVKKKNANAHYLEDYLPRISMHQGDNWGWMSSFAGIFGSASGLFALPIPGLNYALGLAGRTTSMQDRNFMISGLNGMMSGATTTSFMRLREGMNYLCHYATGNPDQNPSQIEFLAYALLGPIFKEQLTVEHIQKFTEAVHEVRDKYWQEGGIPKEKRKEALGAMREVFTGAGLEVLLIDLGLNPGTIAFDKLNGAVGKIGNIGKHDVIMKEQKNYQQALQERLTKYVSEGLITEDQAEWVKSGIEAANHGHKAPAAPAVTQAEVSPPQATGITENKPEKSFVEKTGGKQKERYNDLLKKSDAAGDWRDKAHLAPAHPAPAAIGG